MALTYHIRTATSADLPVIHDLAKAIWEPTYRPILSQEQIRYMFDVIYTYEALAQQMQAGQTFVLLYDEAIPLGFAAYSLKDETERSYKLNKLYLLNSRQGEGLGKRLLQAVEDMVSTAGAKHLYLNVNRYNKAKDFYERCGYRVYLQEDIAIGPYWMNDYVMRKELR